MNLRTFVLLVSVVVALTGLVFLVAVPVNLYMQDGTKLGCGTAVNRDDKAATDYNLNQLTNRYAFGSGRYPDVRADCDGPVDTRLEWAIPLTVAGAVVFAGALISQQKTRNRLDSEADPL